MGVSFGLIQKLFLSAFEYAWAPFYYATVEGAGRRAHVQRASPPTASRFSALMTAGLSAIADDLLRVVGHGLSAAAPSSPGRRSACSSRASTC